METGLQRILLIAKLKVRLKQVSYLGRYLALASLGFALPATAEESLSIEDLGLTPVLERREVKIAGIDTEDFEVGISGGLFSVEDFESNPIAIAHLTYHVTEDFFVQARFAQSELGESSFDRLSGGAQLLGSEDKDITFYDLSLGVNVFPGETFIWDRWAVNSTFYFVGGVGATQFAGSDRFTINGGVGYRLIANDFLAFNFQVRDHVFDTEITGSKKATHNIELGAGFSIFF
jgi:outer membrane beta-barrel protein